MNRHTSWPSRTSSLPSCKQRIVLAFCWNVPVFTNPMRMRPRVPSWGLVASRSPRNLCPGPPGLSYQIMKLLFVASRFPYPPLNGDQVRAYHHLRLLSRRHEIVLLAPEPVEDRTASLEAITPFCAHLESVKTSRLKGIGRLARAPLGHLPLQTLVFYDPEIGRRAAALARAWNVDLVHVQMIRMAPVIDSFDKGLPCVLDLIDSMAMNLSRQAKRSRPPKAWLAAWEARRLETYERRLLGRFDQLVISSPI